MQILIIKDGTVPIAVAKVVATDGEQDIAKHLSAEGFGAGSDLHSILETFTVPDDSQYLYVTWSEFMGFDVAGFSNLPDGIIALNEVNEDDTIHDDADPDHLIRTHQPGDDEWYAHLFRI